MDTQTKYAAIIDSSYTVPGDERSRTNPGHGYPEHTVQYKDFREFKNFEEMKKWVEDEERSKYSRTKYRIISFKPMTVSTTVEIKVEST